MIFSINEFFSKGEEIRSFLQIWSHLLKKSLIENFISLCSVTRIVGLRNIGLGNRPFHTNGLFLYPFETLENQKYLSALKRHRKRPLAQNRLMMLPINKENKMKAFKYIHFQLTFFLFEF